MRKRPRTKILFRVGCLFIATGVGPLAIAVWEGMNAQPLAVPVSLQKGEFTSPYFKTFLGGDDQIDIDRLPFERIPLDLDWKIVDARGAVIQQGVYADPVGPNYRRSPNSLQERLGNVAGLGSYRPHFGQRQRIILNFHQDTQDSAGHAQLEIGQPEISLDLSYAAIPLLAWAGIVGGSGAIILLVLLIRRLMARSARLLTPDA